MHKSLSLKRSNVYFANSSSFLAIKPVSLWITLSLNDPIPNVTIGIHSSLASSAARQNNSALWPGIKKILAWGTSNYDSKANPEYDD